MTKGKDVIVYSSTLLKINCMALITCCSSMLHVFPLLSIISDCYEEFWESYFDTADTVTRDVMQNS